MTGCSQVHVACCSSCIRTIDQQMNSHANRLLLLSGHWYLPHTVPQLLASGKVVAPYVLARQLPPRPVLDQRLLVLFQLGQGLDVFYRHTRVTASETRSLYALTSHSCGNQAKDQHISTARCKNYDRTDEATCVGRDGFVQQHVAQPFEFLNLQLLLEHLLLLVLDLQQPCTRCRAMPMTSCCRPHKRCY